MILASNSLCGELAVRGEFDGVRYSLNHDNTMSRVQVLESYVVGTLQQYVHRTVVFVVLI